MDDTGNVPHVRTPQRPVSMSRTVAKRVAAEWDRIRQSAPYRKARASVANRQISFDIAKRNGHTDADARRISALCDEAVAADTSPARRAILDRIGQINAVLPQRYV